MEEGRHAVSPALVLREPLASSLGDFERGIGEYEIHLEVGVVVVVEAVPTSALPFDTANGEVHLHEPPCRVVRLLAYGVDALSRVFRDGGRFSQAVKFL